jgi:hypothetical protein
VDRYKLLLTEVKSGTPVLPNSDFDTGKPTKAAEYALTDDAYAKLLVQLAKKNFDQASPELRANLLLFYADPSAAFETKKDPARWQGVLAALDQLKLAAPIPATTDNRQP